MRHDYCRNTPEFLWAGQNLAVFGTTATIDVDVQIIAAIGRWYNEHFDTTVEQIESFPEVSP